MTPEEYAQTHGLEFSGTTHEHGLEFAEFDGETTFYTLLTDHGTVDGLRLDDVGSTQGTPTAVVEGESDPRIVDPLGVHEKVNAD